MSTDCNYLNIEHSYLYWICGKGDPLKTNAYEAVRGGKKNETEAYWIKTLKWNGKFEKWKIFWG